MVKKIMKRIVDEFESIEESEKIKKYNNLEISKNSLLFSLLLLTIIIIKFVSIIFIHGFPAFALFYIKYILNIKNGIIYKFVSYLPFVNQISNYYEMIKMFFLVVSFICCGVFLTDSPKKLNQKQLKRKCKLASISFVFLSFSIFTITYDMAEYYQLDLSPNMEQTIYQDKSTVDYTVDDANLLMNYLDNKLDEFSKKNYSNDVNFNYEKQAIKDLNNIKHVIPYLNGLYPSKVYPFEFKLKERYGSNLVGLTSSYLVFYNDSLPSPTLLNTITHEFCHTKSISRENEAVYCSYVAGINSDNELSQYGAYIEAYFRIAFAYSTFDIEKSIQYDDKYTSKCLTEDKEEFCYIYGKANKEYINGSEYLWIKTYSLKNYVDYEEKLITSLTKLVNNGYKLKLEYEKREITLDEVSTLIKEKSSDRLLIQEPFSKELFYEIRDAIEDDKLFLAIMQMENGNEEFNYGDPYKFYFQSIDKDDNTVDMYTYSRIIRLLLIYHDLYGYN